jgi:tetratricopeptide (TPR) repeat protein
MAWFSALAAFVAVLVVGLIAGTVVMLRRKRRVQTIGADEAEVDSSGLSEEEIDELRQRAEDAEQAGNCEVAAELFESAGMLHRAMLLYRQAGNIQKAAALELTSLELNRLALEIPVLDSEVQELLDQSAHEVAQSSPPPADFAAGSADRLRGHASLRPAATRVKSTFPPARHPSSVPPARAKSSFPAPALSFPPPPMSSAPPPASARVKSSAPPPKKPPSERPRARGPSVAELLTMLGPNPEPDLGNIEIFYRLGLAQLAAGQNDEARQAFLTVEDISPGYRDANNYLSQLLANAGNALPSRPPPANSNVHRMEREAAARPGRARAPREVMAAARRRDER